MVQARAKTAAARRSMSESSTVRAVARSSGWCPGPGLCAPTAGGAKARPAGRPGVRRRAGPAAGGGWWRPSGRWAASGSVLVFSTDGSGKGHEGGGGAVDVRILDPAGGGGPHRLVLRRPHLRRQRGGVEGLEGGRQAALDAAAGHEIAVPGRQRLGRGEAAGARGDNEGAVFGLDRPGERRLQAEGGDRKSTRLNSSH